jgi:hypothetical protein
MARENTGFSATQAAGKPDHPARSQHGEFAFVRGLRSHDLNSACHPTVIRRFERIIPVVQATQNAV